MRSPSWIRLSFCLVSAAGVLPALCAQEPMAVQPPFVRAVDPAPGQGLLLRISAQRALEMGFASVASDLYQRLLNDPNTPFMLRGELTIELATALLAEDRFAEAEAALQKLAGTPTAVSRLRWAMIHARLRRYDAARGELAAIKVEELPEHDRGWYHFVDGMLMQVGGKLDRAVALYQQAVDSARSEAQRARFELAREQVHLELGHFSEKNVNELRQKIERPDRLLYLNVSQLAVELAGLRRPAEAVTLLQRQLQALPNEERGIADHWRLLLGIIGGADGGVGRNALGQLLASGADPVKQRVALQLLAQSSRSGGNRDDFRRRMDELLALPAPHPLTEELLLFRAQVALAESDYARAELSAQQLLERFPGSQLRGAARGVLTGVYWAQGRHRNAASQATLARDILPSGSTRSQMNVLIAEAYFRAGVKDDDANALRNAADAYAAALQSVPEGVSPGSLIFQRVLSEIEADRLGEAEAVLDQFAGDMRLDVVNRWQAEWNLSRAFQAAKKTKEAYGRVTRLVQESGASRDLPGDLRAQLGWLQAHLALAAGEPARALELAEPLLRSLGDVQEPLRSQIASTTLLLQAQASFAVSPPKTDAGTEFLNRLRAEHPRSEAAIYSYFVQADEFARKGLLVDAQSVVQKVADQFPQNTYAPFALYKAAQFAERRAQEIYYREAFNILERLVSTYGKSDLVFYARLKQGNLLRLVNAYGSALQVYELLVNEFSTHRDVFSAQIALADCHAGMAAADPSHFESAATIYERLLDLQTAPVDVRAEAGYKYGLGLSRKGDLAAARAVWGRLVAIFIPDESTGVALGAKGRTWMARTLLDLGDLLEKQSKLEQAGDAYDLIIAKELPGSALAREKLDRLRPAVPVPASP